MIVFGDATVLSQAVESGRIDATVVPGFLSRRLAEKGSLYWGDPTKRNSLWSAVRITAPKSKKRRRQ
jgi:hypothetical protein